MEGGAGVGLEDFGKEAFSFGVPSAVVPLGWKSGWGGFSRASAIFRVMWVAGGSPACLTQHSEVD